MKVSTGYRQLKPEEVSAIAKECEMAWASAAIPERQWTNITRGELERFKTGERLPHFQALLDLLNRTELNNPTLLEVGASTGFYREILRMGGFPCQYTALDYSPHFWSLAMRLFPDMAFKIGDARALPYEDGFFEIVVSGCVMLHVMEYEKVLAESARVASKFVVLSRTPVLTGSPTTYYRKEAYGVPCLEIHFSESELFSLFARYGLTLVAQKDIFMDSESTYGHRSYLLKK